MLELLQAKREANCRKATMALGGTLVSRPKAATKNSAGKNAQSQNRRPMNDPPAASYNQVHTYSHVNHQF